MGYSSYMDGCSFKSNLTVTQLNTLYEEYAGLHTPSGIGIYSFEEADAEGEYQPEGMGTHGKYYDTDDLAIFISMVCKDKCNLYFVGEEGERWGYIIYPGIVMEEKMVNGDILFHDLSSENIMPDFKKMLRETQPAQDEKKKVEDEGLVELDQRLEKKLMELERYAYDHLSGFKGRSGAYAAAMVTGETGDRYQVYLEWGYSDDTGKESDHTTVYVDKTTLETIFDDEHKEDICICSGCGEEVTLVRIGISRYAEAKGLLDDETRNECVEKLNQFENSVLVAMCACDMVSDGTGIREELIEKLNAAGIHCKIASEHDIDVYTRIMS